ncbi:Spindle pole body protein pcp1 [Psilocybe cubensis]|uniref:Spindle pole body protein pcp1 n=2 Tax=Psilocybe cubensis TaxID=181762 RepID=A0ACB8H6J0_PSICU|nr:Spindle pole body protein pcp1 [Psilocybe cubensis]KAH9483481.1 Spindle pole body protein pcp1 [Psilocybe cubensis]
MSAALTVHPDLSSSQHELSLGSFASFSSIPGRTGLRVPSTSSRTTAQSSAPLSTPSPPNASAFRRKGDDPATSLSSRLDMLNDDGDEPMGGDGDVLDTPSAEKKRWTDAPETPGAVSRSKRSKGEGKGAPLTLRDQEKHIDNLKKENFNIKLRVHFLEEQLARLAPDQIDAALKQNINLKIEVQQRGMEIKKLKKLVLSLEHELERLQRSGGGGSNRGRERELEERLEERERELQELRRKTSGHDDSVLRELEARNAELEDELENTRGLLEENMDEIDRLKDVIERRGDDSANESSVGGESRRERMKRRIEELEMDNDDLRAKLQEHVDALAQREEEKEDLADEVDALRLELEDVQRRREAESIERSESRAQILEEREEREAVEDDLNALRDKLAALIIELQQKEDEIDLKNKEIEELVGEHQRIVEVVEDEWRGEVEEARGQVEELRDVLAEREAESKDLRVNISELEANTNDLHAKFETALAHLEQESDQKDSELESLQETIDKLGEQIYQLEDENDRMKEEHERIREDEAAERERLEALSAALKEKIASLKEELAQMTENYETCSQEIHAHRTRQEELAQHIEDLVDEVQRERTARERAEGDLEAADKEHDAAMRREKRVLEAKESALQSALNDLARTQSLLSQREADLQAVQSALQALEAESKRLGETHTTTRFSLQLETDRLKRDLERLEDELTRARKELDDREAKNRDRDSVVDRLHAEKRDLESQLAAQTQARLNLSEKLDGSIANLKASEAEIVGYKAKIADLEQRLNKDQRSLLNAEVQYRDQLTERNTLLLTIYQYLDKILGVDKTPKKGNQAETKPFTNFGVFHDNLITRLKALSQIQLDFDKRCKEIEGKFSDKLNDMRKQLDQRWKQIDKFESSLKTYAETKAGWKRKFAQKEGELEAIKTTNAEMASQLASMKRPGGGDAMELRSLATRAANAERRLNNAQNQLITTEEKIAAINQKNAAADSKWEARVKEYEARLKAAEERIKRERQGGKERVAELEASVSRLQRQLELAQKRNSQLNGVLDNKDNRASGSGSSTPSR